MSLFRMYTTQTAMSGVDVGLLAPVEALGYRLAALLWVVHPIYPNAGLKVRSIEWIGSSVRTGDVEPYLLR